MHNMRYTLIFLLLLGQSCFAQKPMDTYMQMQIGMKDSIAMRIFHKDWREDDVFDTGPFRTYYVGGPNNDTPQNNAFRLVLSFMDDRIANKELRLSTTQRNCKAMLDSTKNTLVKIYGKPTLDTLISVPGFAGTSKVYSWSFPNATDKDIYRIDVAAYKLRTRLDYTVIVAIFTLQYNKMLPVRNYLHY